jgi:hypothetical protein
MKNIVVTVTLALLLAGCAGLPAGHGPEDRGEETVKFTEEHHRTKDVAFLAAAGWLSEHYQGGTNVLQRSDKESGTMIAKGTYRWSKPVDSFQLHFHEGTVGYSLTVKVTDNRVEMEFQTGGVSGDTEVGPKDLMPQLLPFYQNIKNSIMKAISEK